MNRTSRRTSGLTSGCGVHCGYGVWRSCGRENKGTISTMNSISRCSSRCAIHYGYCACPNLLDRILDRIGTSLAFYKGQKGLSLENPEKNLKRGSRALSAPGSNEKESKNYKMSSFFSGFWPVFDSFSSLFSPGAESPREPLFGLFSGVF